MPEVPTKQTMRYAVANLFDSKTLAQELEHLALRHSVVCTEHPFGLSLKKHNLTNSTELYIIKHPGITDSSVDGMKVALRAALGSRTHQLQKQVHIHLRVIKAEHDVSASRAMKPEIRHWLWFEVSWYHYNFMCSGCNDFSGKGGNGGTLLMQMFSELAALEDVTLEVVTIPLPHSESVREMILAKMDQRFAA